MSSLAPALSVILPAFNCEKYVSEAIESILAQSFSDFELLIADDGSSDDSRAIIDRYQALDTRIQVFHNSQNRGKIWTVNRLFQFCRAEFITIHDADDISHAERFRKQVEYLSWNQSLVMCGTSFTIVRENGVFFRNVVMPDAYEQILNGIRNASQFHGPTMMFRRCALSNEVYRPFFDEYNEDCDLAFRLIEKAQCVNLPELLYTYRIRRNSLTKKIDARKKNLYRMALKFHEQRKVCGSDDIMEGRSDLAEDKLCQLMEPYLRDPSLIYRENAAFLMYYHLNRDAIYNAWKAVRLKPFQSDNVRTLQYCIRKTLLCV